MCAPLVKMEVEAGSDRHRDEGFVLPYVLAVIAILSLLTALGANTLQRSQKSLAQMGDRNELLYVLDEAEALSLYVFLTRPIVSGGLDLSGQLIDESELAMGEPVDESNISAEDVWLATGGVRKVSIGPAVVDVVYQDADGLISLNTAAPSVLKAWLGSSAGPAANSSELAAQLADYRDTDSFRRFQGAERAEYRLVGLPAPSNSVVRHMSELGQVYGFAGFLGSTPPDFSVTTLFSTSGVPRQRGMPSALVSMLARVPSGALSGNDDLNAHQLVNSRYPSERAQFTFTAYTPGASIGLRRVVEFERTAAAPDRPYTRRLVAQYVVPNDPTKTEQNSKSNDVPLKISFSSASGARP